MKGKETYITPITKAYWTTTPVCLCASTEDVQFNVDANTDYRDGTGLELWSRTSDHEATTEEW